jgi:hypothetical protein
VQDHELRRAGPAYHDSRAYTYLGLPVALFAAVFGIDFKTEPIEEKSAKSAATELLAKHPMLKIENL